jgi:phosphoserine phosphatase RsbU/P
MALFAQTPQLVPYDHVRDMLRANAFPVLCGIITSVAGFSAMLLSRSRGRKIKLALLYFGALSALYGLRLLANTDSIHVLVGGPDSFWGSIDFVGSMIITIPLFLFLREFLAPRYGTFFLWLVIISALFAAVAIPAVFLGGGLDAAHLASKASNILVIAEVLAVVWIVLRSDRTPSPQGGTVLAGFLIAAAFVIETNLASARLIHAPTNIEPLGMLICFSCLGYAVTQRAFTDQQHLSALRSELEIARQIQLSLLPPSMPSIRGVEIAARYSPMTAVAGDFYDFIVVDDRRVGILLADVSGHGVPAALIASMVKVAFTAQVAHAADPARVLRGLNDILCGKFRDDQFVTAAYVFLDSEKGVLVHAGAGHPDLLVWSGTESRVVAIASLGPIIGMLPGVEFLATGVAIRPGDRCLLYTDGILEASNNSGELYGSERLQRLPHNGSAVSAIDALSRSVYEWSGRNAASQEDDQTLIIIDATKDSPPGSP